MNRWRAFILLVISAMASLLVALESPSGVLAIPHNEKPGNYGFDCGGSAVVIAPGQALTLVEALPEEGPTTVAIGGRRVLAEIVTRGSHTGAVLLRFSDPAGQIAALPLADSTLLRQGDVVWSVGNSYGILEQDGVVALSRGVVSGLYSIPPDSPPVHGRGGRVLSDYRGAVIETDAAVNDGNQGGALLDEAGNVVALVCHAQTRERRLGTAIPIHLICADLGLPAPTTKPVGGNGIERILADHAAEVSASVALVYLERPTGPGNPQASPRPRPITDDVPPYLRERMQNDWNRYYHEQQIFYTDQPVSALVVGKDLLLTAASNLHGDPKRGRVLTDGGPVDCTIVAVHRPLDLALLRTSQPLPFPIAHLSERNDLASGDPIAVIGRHRASVAATCTTGVVSATERRVNQGEFVLHQTDAMANYGSLGGAVIDRFGDVAGLIVFLGPQGERPWHINSGVAPFIDAASIRRALPGLIEGTSVARARIIGLGVELLRNSNDNESLRIGKVYPKTAAADAGLQAGDVLRAIDGEIMRSVEDVTRTLIRHRSGDTVQLRLDRNGEEVRIGVTLRAFAGDEEP